MGSTPTPYLEPTPPKRVGGPSKICSEPSWTPTNAREVDQKSHLDSKMAQDGSQMAPDGSKMGQDGVKMAPRWPQDVPKMAPRGPKNVDFP